MGLEERVLVRRRVSVLARGIGLLALVVLKVQAEEWMCDLLRRRPLLPVGARVVDRRTWRAGCQVISEAKSGPD
jgi:hypothetical protein